MLYPVNTLSNALLFFASAFQFAATERLRELRGLPRTTVQPHQPSPREHLRLAPPPPPSYQIGVVTDAGDFMCLQEVHSLSLAIELLDHLTSLMKIRLKVVEFPSRTVVAIRE